MARAARNRATSDARPEPELETGHEGNGEEAHYLFEPVEPFFLRTGKRGGGARTGKDEPGSAVGRNAGVLEQTLDLVSEGVAILDANGGVNHANLALARMCGVSPDAWDEMPLEWHLSEESRRDFRNLLLALRRGEPASKLEIRLRASKERKILSVAMVPSAAEPGFCIVLRDPPGTVEPPRGRRDATTPGRAELRRVSHDLNNLLTGIIGNAELALLGPPGENHRKYVNEIVDQAVQAVEMIRDSFLRSEPEPVESLPPEPVVIPDDLPNVDLDDDTSEHHLRTVLLLEQDSNIRATWGQTLKSLGYRTRLAATEEECLVALAEFDALDALLLDPWRQEAIQPGCVERALELRPELPVIAYGTGGNASEPVWAPGVEAVLLEPYKASHVYEALRACAESRAARTHAVSLPLEPRQDGGPPA